MADSATSEQNPTVISGPNRAFSFWIPVFFDIMDPIREAQEGVILINPFEQAVIIHGRSLESYLQSLAVNEAGKYGSPPASKASVEGMTTRGISESGLVCSICLEDFEVGVEAKEMPCLHKYHSECILPWLKLHSTCPVCRFQMPAEERDKGTSGVEGEGGGEGDSGERRGASGEAQREGDGENSRERRMVWINFPWLVSISESRASEIRDSGVGEN
ncbi:hypothetical protein AMTRI_Chr04g190420 [Amborella trichopoda]